MLFNLSALKHDGVESLKAEEKNDIIQQNEAVTLQWLLFNTTQTYTCILCSKLLTTTVQPFTHLYYVKECFVALSVEVCVFAC